MKREEYKIKPKKPFCVVTSVIAIMAFLFNLAIIDICGAKMAHKISSLRPLANQEKKEVHQVLTSRLKYEITPKKTRDRLKQILGVDNAVARALVTQVENSRILAMVDGEGLDDVEELWDEKAEEIYREMSRKEFSTLENMEEVLEFLGFWANIHMDQLNKLVSINDLYQQLNTYTGGFRRKAFIETLYAIFGKDYFELKGKRKKTRDTVVYSELMTRLIEGRIERHHNLIIPGHEGAVFDILRRVMADETHRDDNLAAQELISHLRMLNGNLALRIVRGVRYRIWPMESMPRKKASALKKEGNEAEILSSQI